MSTKKRDTGSYLDSAKQLSKFIPSLQKYKRRKTLRPQEKAAIARKEKILRATYTQLENLIPVTKKQAREFKDILWQPETIIQTGKRKGQTKRHNFVRALQLRNVGKDTHIIKKVGKNIYIVSNGRTWVYWKLDDVKSKTMERAATRIFEDVEREPGEDDIIRPDEFDIERIVDLARQAFENPQTKAVYLWAESGRVGFGMTKLSSFINWIRNDYLNYHQVEKWVNGLAILVADVGDKISATEFASFSMTREERINERKRNRAEYRRKRK